MLGGRGEMVPISEFFLSTRIYMWQSQIEIEYYSYFELITEFDAK